MILAILAMAIAVGVALAWQNPWAPAVGALGGLVVALVGDLVHVADLQRGADELWRPVIAIAGIMITTACAAELGIFTRLASWIEPRTRGPVRYAFRFVFVVAAMTAALLSNDAAILLLTPVVVELLRTVYPKRNPKFVVPFAFAAFIAAGVAPLPTGNPMNLVVASRAGIGFNDYALHMIPVALAGWFVAYRVLAWIYRDALSDESPALGPAPAVVPLSTHAKLVLVITATSIAAYPILALAHQPIWPIAASAGAACFATALHAGGRVRRIVGGVSWELVPFLYGVLVLATAVARAGVTDHLAALYRDTPAPIATVGVVAAGGSALIDNHPMALLHSLTLQGWEPKYVYAALVGGDLGPRLLPIGSLAGLIWTHALRRQGVTVPLGTFIRVGVLVTIPSLAASLAVLWLVT